MTPSTLKPCVKTKSSIWPCSWAGPSTFWVKLRVQYIIELINQGLICTAYADIKVSQNLMLHHYLGQKSLKTSFFIFGGLYIRIHSKGFVVSMLNVRDSKLPWYKKCCNAGNTCLVKCNWLVQNTNVVQTANEAQTVVRHSIDQCLASKKIINHHQGISWNSPLSRSVSLS